MQPGDDKESLDAMEAEIKGGPCLFDMSLKKGSLRLHPLGFHGRKCSEAESYLHSFMNEALAVNVGINKWKVFLWGREFTVVTDCRALIWLLTYEGTNAAVRRLQFEILGFWFTIHHRVEALNGNCDSVSQLGLDFEFNPVLLDYYRLAFDLKSKFPCVNGPIAPNNLPGYRHNLKKKREAAETNKTPSTMPNDTPSQAILHAIAKSPELNSISNTPIFTVQIQKGDDITIHKCTEALHHQPLVCNALKMQKFRWVVNGFGSGAFFSVCQTFNIPFIVPIASDYRMEGRSLLQEYDKASQVVAGSYELLDIISSSTDEIHGYFATAPWEFSNESELNYFRVQAQIIKTLQSRCQLATFIMHLHNNTTDQIKSDFVHKLTECGWNIAIKLIHYPSFNDAVDDTGCFLFAIHTGRVGPKFHQKFEIVEPPQTQNNIQSHLLQEYNLKRFAMMQYPPLDDEEQQNNGFYLFPVKRTSPEQDRNKAKITHHVYFQKSNNYSEVGARVCDIDHPTIPMEIINPNPFQHLFGVKFKDEGQSWIRSISTFEYSSCFELDRNLKLKYSSDRNLAKQLYRGCPGNTMKAIVEVYFERLLTIRNATPEIDDHDDMHNEFIPAGVTAPAATAFQVLQGVVTMKLPTKAQWRKAYQDDSMCSSLFDLVTNPGLINKSTLSTIHYRFRQPLREGAIIIENEFLIIKEKLDENSYVKLRIVPEALWDIIFIAFHANPIGGHFSVYYTFHRIRLRFFWPKMYVYIKHLCSLCAACRLANSMHNKSKELVYSFPVDAPLKLVVCDIYIKQGNCKLLMVKKHYSYC